MRKFRGQKKYYKRLLNNDLDVYFDNLDFHSWFDFWHDHPDWYGYSNISWKHRYQHLQALMQRFNYLKEKFRKRTEDFQTFCIIDINDSSQDSVYIHTKNPNQDNFPVQVERYNGNIRIFDQLRDFLESSGYEWFFNKWNRDDEIVNLIYIYDKETGRSIEKK
jgi:hypothetical protein